MEEINHFFHEEHPLKLIDHLEKPGGVVVECDMCEKIISVGDSVNEWLYQCGNCRYFAHIKCALNAQKIFSSTPRDDLSTSEASDDVQSLLHFPMSKAFTDPLKLLHSKLFGQDDKETTEINHWSHHAHPLILNVEDSQGNTMIPDINSDDPIKPDIAVCSHCHCHHILRMVTDLGWLSFADGACPSFWALAVSVKDMTKDSRDSSKKEISTTGEERVQQARLQTLKFNFEMLHMKEDETIDTFTEKLTTLVNKAASLGHTMEDETLVRKLLNPVPDRYLQIVASIEQYSDLSEMTMKEAIGRLKTYEERIKYKQDKQMNSQESLMFTRHEGQRKPFREYGHGRFNQSRGREQDKNNYQSKREVRASFEEDTRDKTLVTCYRCHKLGHYAYECPNKRKNQVKEHSNFIEEDLEPTLLMATINEKK
nr:zinc finger, CCHC-type [Tanacetum cinerariifolium]